MKLDIRKPARADLDDIFLQVAVERPIAAERLVNRLLDAMNGLLDFPMTGRPTSDGQRELVTVKPYVILYHVNDGRIAVLRVLHAARRR